VSFSDISARLAATEIPWKLARTLSWFLAVNTAGAGWDYYHTPPTAARTLEMVERFASLHTWGILYLVSAGILMLGLLFSRHVVVWLGHLLGAGLYALFTVATAQTVWQLTRDDQIQVSLWRFVTQSAVIAAGHVFLCWARGPVPRRGDEQ
jgi:hypothetical protein